MRRVVMCADDFGLHAAVDGAVLALAAAGRLSATSCMTGAPHWRHGAARLRDLARPGFEAGLHLDLTEHPFDTRLRSSLPGWLARSYLRAVPRAALRTEIERQLDAFEWAMGRPPSHVDGHQHLHQLPVIRDTLLDVLAARYGDARPWLRSTRHAAADWTRKARLIETLGARMLARAAVRQGFRQNRHLLGVYDFRGDTPRYVTLLEQWLAIAVDGDVLMCHPADGAVPGDAIAAARITEYQVLAGPAFAALLACQQVRLQGLPPAAQAASL